jgi:heptaprenylglyceryl phosphate synthase
VRLTSRILDTGVQREIEESGFSVLRDAVEDSPLVAKYDPEDFDDGFPVGEIGSVLSLPSVGAVQIGGSGDSVTNENMNRAFSTIEEANRDHRLPVMLEPGKPEDVEDGGLDSSVLTEPDIFNKPRVWNTGESEWINGHHRYFQRLLNGKLDENAYSMIREELSNGIEEMNPLPGSGIDHLLDGLVERYMEDIGEDGARARARQKVDSDTVTEVYYVVNPESAVAEVTGAVDDIRQMSQEEISQDIGGMVSDLAQDGYRGIIYIESSGALAPPELVERAREEVDLHGIEDDILIAYGGGVGTDETVDVLEYGTAIGELETSEQVEEYLDSGADTVIVGNSIQESGGEILR